LEREHYEVRKFVLPAVAVDAKHRRDRIFVVAYSNSPAVWNLPKRQEIGRNNIQASRQAITSHHGYAQSMANANEHERRGEDSSESQRREPWVEHGSGSSGFTERQPKQTLANTNSPWELQQKGDQQESWGWSGNSSEQDVANSQSKRMERDWSFGVEESQPSGSQGLSGRNSSGGEPRVWQAEPCVGRVADGVPSRVDRIKGLGNAVVPQLIQAIGELVIEADKEMRSDR
jgi:DNA (cytosine-5)-methyltransferase 1